MDANQIVRRLKREIKLLIWLWLTLCASATAGESLQTPLEESGYQRLPDTVAIAWFLRRLEALSPRLKIFPYGHSAGGRPLLAVLISSDPQFLRTGKSAPGKLKVMLVGGQHGTEPSGTEALQILAKEAATSGLEDLLKVLDLIVVVNSNPDGRDSHRRVNAHGVNLSTDYVSLSQPETQALVKLLIEFRPHALLDIHESAILKKKSLGAQGYLTDFEAQFEYANHPNVAPELGAFSEQVFLPELLQAVSAQGLPARHYLGEITSIDQPITHGGVSLRNLRNYAGMRGIFAWLVENRLDPPGDWPTPRNIQARVAKQSLCLKAFLAKLIEFRHQILARVRKAREEPKVVALRAGYAPLPDRAEIAVALRRLEDGRKVTRKFAYLGRVVGEDWVLAPRAYAILTHHLGARRRRALMTLLDRHGIAYLKLTRSKSVAAVVHKLTKIEIRRWRQGVIAHREVKVKVQEKRQKLKLLPGDLWLPLRQEAGALALLLLDPRSSTGIFQDPAYTSWLSEGKEGLGVYVCAAYQQPHRDPVRAAQ